MITTYQPSEFTIGYRELNYGDRGNTRVGFPSCKWLKDGKWTEVGKFTRHTDGYKPHKQLDAEKQMQKDLGMSVEKFSNEPISGFRILAIHTHPKTTDDYTLVQDPRGFCLQLRSDFTDRVILTHHLGISGSGVLEGKWFYVWQDQMFSGIMPEHELDKVDMNDEKLAAQEKSLRSFKTEDLVVGNVYDMASPTGDKSDTRRVVYLGQKLMPSFPAVRNFLNNGYRPAVLRYHWTGDALKYYLSPTTAKSLKWLPWNVESHVKKAESVMRPWTLAPAFILLEDMFSAFTKTIYCDDLAGVPAEELEHSLVFSAVSTVSSLLAGKDVVKKLVNESAIQVLKIVRNCGYLQLSRARCATGSLRYTSASDYKTLKLEMLQLGVDKFLEMVKGLISDRLELVPPQMPADLKKWCGKVNEWCLKEEQASRQQRVSSYC